MIQDDIDHLLDVLVPSFSKVLILLVSLALPCPCKESVKDLLYPFANFHLSHIANKLCRSSSLGDIVHEGAGEIG